MRYLDGELSPDERARIDAALAQSTELQREIAIFRALKADVQELSFHPGAYHTSVWTR
jgi:anti-sigma factor RsiW